jgi:ADP-ribose pyrophosphatase YjhB (NUDIX family)
MPLSNNKIPTKVVYGERISREGKLRLGCSAVLFDIKRNNVLLTRRADNGQWCLPGGMIDPGESVSEGCKREVFEETGLQVEVIRLTGVYSDPNRLTIYPDGNKACVIVLTFEVRQIGGILGISNETIGAEYFPIHEAVEMDLFHGHAKQIQDAYLGQESAFIR